MVAQRNMEYKEVAGFAIYSTKKDTKDRVQMLWFTEVQISVYILLPDNSHMFNCVMEVDHISVYESPSGGHSEIADNALLFIYIFLEHCV